MLSGKYSIYTLIHKYLRSEMCNALVQLGRVDDTDDDAVAGQLGNVSALLDFVQLHLELEDRFIHGAIQARKPNLFMGTDTEHKEHAATVKKLKHDVTLIGYANGSRRSALLHNLYCDLAHFVAENLVHMQAEETHNARVLEDLFSEAEVQHIHENIVGALSPEKRLRTTTQMLATLMHSERMTVLSSMYHYLPDETFITLLKALKPLIPLGQFIKILSELGREPETDERAA